MTLNTYNNDNDCNYDMAKVDLFRAGSDLCLKRPSRQALLFTENKLTKQEYVVRLMVSVPKCVHGDMSLKLTENDTLLNVEILMFESICVVRLKFYHFLSFAQCSVDSLNDLTCT